MGTLIPIWYLNFWKHKIIVIKGGIITIKSSRNQAFTGIISFSAGSLNKIIKAAGMENSCSLYLLSDENLWVEKYYYIFVKEKQLEIIQLLFWIYIIIYLTYTLYYYLFVKNHIDRKRQMEYYKDVMKKPSDIGVSDGSS